MGNAVEAMCVSCDGSLRSISVMGLLTDGVSVFCVMLSTSRCLTGASDDSSWEMLCLLPMLVGVLDRARAPGRRYFTMGAALIGGGCFHICGSTGRMSLTEKELDADSILDISATSCLSSSSSMLFRSSILESKELVWKSTVARESRFDAGVAV